MSTRRGFELVLLVVLLAFMSSVAAAQSLSAPTVLTATTVSKKQIDLAWDDPNPVLSGLGEAGYIVERSKGSTCCSFSKVFTSGPGVTSWSSTGLSTGTMYHYRVRGFVVIGGQTTYSAYSPIASTTTQSSLYPNPPTSLVATVLSETQISLKWSDKANNELGYQVEHALTSTGPWTLVGTVGINQKVVTDTGLNPSTAYFYRVRAFNAVGQSPTGNVATATTKADLIAPTASIDGPASGTTYTTAQAVTITAAAGDNVQVAMVEFYDGGALKGTATTAPYSHTWSVTSANNGLHTWTAKAIDGSNNSSISLPVNLTVNIQTVSIDTTAPTGTVVINSGAAATAATAATLSLSATDAVGVTGYYVSTSATPPLATAAGWVAVPATLSYTGSVGTTLSPEDGTKTVYAWYKDAAGNVSGMASDAILLDQTAPANGGATAVAGSAQVTVSWTGFADGGSGLAATAPYTLVYSAGSVAASCAGGTPLLPVTGTSLLHTGPTNGTTYG